MKKIIMLNRITLDGYFAGPNGEIDWFIPDPDIDKELMKEEKTGNPDTVLFGRVTYQMFEDYWPKIAQGQTNLAHAPTTPEALAAERQTADALTNMKKIVFSKTLKTTNWQNTTIHPGNPTEEAKRLKQENTGDMIIFGSGTITQQLTTANLIDDYWLILTPTILGTGKTLFQGTKKTNLQLKETKSYKTGNVTLHYTP